MIVKIKAGVAELVDTKKTGQSAEIAFMLKCIGLGLPVSIPFGNSEKYDCIVDGNKLWRVQVKSTSRRDTENRQDRFYVSIASGQKSKTPYTAEQIDILAIYVIPIDTWYIIPVNEISGKRNIPLFPHRDTNSRYDKYREAWDIFTSCFLAGTK